MCVHPFQGMGRANLNIVFRCLEPEDLVEAGSDTALHSSVDAFSICWRVGLIHSSSSREICQSRAEPGENPGNAIVMSECRNYRSKHRRNNNKFMSFVGNLDLIKDILFPYTLLRHASIGIHNATRGQL